LDSQRRRNVGFILYGENDFPNKKYFGDDWLYSWVFF
jgi:hypothetical protein